MKKLFTLLLTFLLMLSAVPALADEAVQAREPLGFPEMVFGAEDHQAMEVFDARWGAQYSYSDEPAWETITMSDGTEVSVMTLAAVPTDPDFLPMTAKLCFIDEKLVALVQEIDFPEGADIAEFEISISQSLGCDPIALDTGKIGNILELLREAAHLEDGQKGWPYTVSGTLAGDGTETPIHFSGIVTAHLVDGTLYVAEFPYAKD